MGKVSSVFSGTEVMYCLRHVCARSNSFIIVLWTVTFPKIRRIRRRAYYIVCTTLYEERSTREARIKRYVKAAR